ncbi:MAG TPA: hypothetical protein DIW81_04015 [Planctomycetaceae bacterium]|nr:hypothetical protein [Rubinisphaera sp.]HCS50747.1 hypothetical protein [Planctomycetaceae bacterium]|tara:strand:- start:4653 stop:5483 length:831 start_codon:yes stop_codon:yes gene_type:complete
MAVVAGLVASTATASILDTKSLAIDFTDINDARAKATWSKPDLITIDRNGLGWDGESASSRDGWIQTTPLALGLSWRPPLAVSVRVSIHPKPSEFFLNNGQKSIPYGGNVYVRYSPDLKHWSTWQVLQASEPQGYEKDQNPGRHFISSVRVPNSERDRYGKLLSEYAKLDVQWKSDEDAVVRWILEKEPDFFATQLPFIGYIQFQYEAGFYGGQRITSFKANVSYGMSGIHSLPKDNDAYKGRCSRSWSFNANQTPEDTEPSPALYPKPAARPPEK